MEWLDGMAKKAEREGAPGGVNLCKAINTKGEFVLAFQLVDANDKPLAFMDLTRAEAVALSEQIKLAIDAIWGK